MLQRLGVLALIEQSPTLIGMCPGTVRTSGKFAFDGCIGFILAAKLDARFET